jgi:molecular chaperone GrpE
MGKNNPKKIKKWKKKMDSIDGEIEASAQSPKQVLTTDVELKNLQRELLDYKDKYLRLLADAENTRKRMQKERQDLTKYAVENIIIDFLNPIDQLENALKFAQQMSDEVKNWAFGFQMILTQFKDILANNGVSAFESQGKMFDPHIHEAVEIAENTDYPNGFIIEEYIRGYKMGDRTIRPARVKVAKSVTQALSQNEEELD